MTVIDTSIEIDRSPAEVRAIVRCATVLLLHAPLKEKTQLRGARHLVQRRSINARARTREEGPFC
jgi:hypothetical protein